MHLDDTTLEHALHGELDPEARPVVERHLGGCVACAERLTAARDDERRLFGLLEALDHEPPALDWSAVRSARGPDRASGGRRSLLAAGLAVLLVGAAVLAALPGSPVRSWLGAIRHEAPADRPGPAGGSTDRSGIAVVPDADFEVAFAARQRAGRVRVTLVSTGELELMVTGEPVELESGADRLVVANAGSSARYELRVPRDLHSFRVTVGGTTVFEKRDGAIRAGARRDAGGAYLVDLSVEPR